MNGFILCVEDNLKVQRFNKPLLEKKGFTVKLAMTLAEAREELAKETPDCIIPDIHLPDGNGLDFLRELRESSNIPVIALTNNKMTGRRILNGGRPWLVWMSTIAPGLILLLPGILFTPLYLLAARRRENNKEA